jgi:hypothetical protein
MTSMGEPIPLAVFELDYPTPPAGWAAELNRRGVAIVLDDIGRPSIPRAAARDLLTEHREEEARKARHREEIERRAIEADRAFRAQLSRGIPADAVPVGMTAAQLMMAADPMDERSQRESVLQHALRYRDGAIVYHSIGGES